MDNTTNDELSLMTQKLLETYEELTLIHDLVSKIGGMLDLTKVFDEIMDEAVAISKAKWGGILLIDESSGKLELKASKGVDETSQKLIGYSCEKGLINKAINEARSIIGKEMDSFIMVVPLKLKDKQIGAICLGDKIDGDSFYSTEMKLVKTMSFIVSFIIENARLYTSLQQLFFSAVESLSFAIDEKDPYTHGHSRRVTQYSLEIASMIGLTEKEKIILKLAAVLHDVGKIGISEAILHKKGKLDYEDWEEIKQHPMKGVHILQPMEESQTITAPVEIRFENIHDIIDGVKYHHERYDGTGYPEHLCGENIPLIPRIIAVADAYDAMTSDRAYRKGMSNSDACMELKVNAGLQHDPKIVEVFLRLKGM
ncbi:HD-GYP domain-containing protein [Candidatus Desantisbacteria bacterium]|nr:HD-GYP domain-containing protein [Candidatus Desantisbacteria bacterium]